MLIAFHSSISQNTSVEPVVLVALSLADRGFRTLLLDLTIDPTAPTMLLEDGMPRRAPKPCYGDVVRGTCTVSEAIVRCRDTGLHILRGGTTEEALRYDGRRQDRLAEIALPEQITAARQGFDLTLVALPDRMRPEVTLVLPQVDGMVLVLDPSAQGRRSLRHYFEYAYQHPDFRLAPLIGALVYGRTAPEPKTTAFFSQQFGKVLLPGLVQADDAEIAVFAGLPLEHVSSNPRDAQAMGRVVDELQHRLYARGGIPSLTACRETPDRRPLTEAERRALQGEFQWHMDKTVDDTIGQILSESHQGVRAQ